MVWVSFFSTFSWNLYLFHISFFFSLLFGTQEVYKTRDITIHFREGDNCPGFNRIYTYCGNKCNTTCKTFNYCEYECIRGCLCAPNYAEANLIVKGMCVPVHSPLCRFDRYWNN